MRTDRRTMAVTAVGSLVVGAVTGLLVTGLGAGAQADELPLAPLATRSVDVAADATDDDVLPLQIANRGYACPAFTFRAPDSDHTAGARTWSVNLARAATRTQFSVVCVKAADVGGLYRYIDKLRRATDGPRLVHDPVVEVLPFGDAVRTDLTVGATSTLTEWHVERDGWIVTAGVQRPTEGGDALVVQAQAMLATWRWGPPQS